MRCLEPCRPDLVCVVLIVSGYTRTPSVPVPAAQPPCGLAYRHRVRRSRLVDTPAADTSLRDGPNRDTTSRNGANPSGSVRPGQHAHAVSALERGLKADTVATVGSHEPGSITPRLPPRASIRSAADSPCARRNAPRPGGGSRGPWIRSVPVGRGSASCGPPVSAGRAAG